MDLRHPGLAKEVAQSAAEIDKVLEKQDALTPELHKELEHIQQSLHKKETLAEISQDDRWAIRQSIFRFRKALDGAKLSPEAHASIAGHRKSFSKAIEYVPLWVIVGVALALGIGTTIGYKRIVVTIAEKIGKTHLTYAQGAAAETVAAATIGLADFYHLPVSTTHVLSSGIAGTMWANKSGIQGGTIQKILMAWVLTLPAAILISATIFLVGGWLVGAHSAAPAPVPAVSSLQHSLNAALTHLAAW
jgi:phosphate/sulfate permease